MISLYKSNDLISLFSDEFIFLEELFLYLSNNLFTIRNSNSNTYLVSHYLTDVLRSLGFY